MSAMMTSTAMTMRQIFVQRMFLLFQRSRGDSLPESVWASEEVRRRVSDLIIPWFFTTALAQGLGDGRNDSDDEANDDRGEYNAPDPTDLSATQSLFFLTFEQRWPWRTSVVHAVRRAGKEAVARREGQVVMMKQVRNS